MAYQFGGGSYGGVYRPAPNIPQQQVGPPKAQVGAPPLPPNDPDQPDNSPGFNWPSAYWALPWPSVQMGQYARDKQVPLVAVGAPPVRFPPLGGWQPGTMDPPHTRTQTGKVRSDLIRIGNDPVAFPFLGAWQPETMDPPVASTWVPLESVHLVVPPLPIGGVPVAHPKLGQWWPARPDLTWPLVQSYYTWKADVPPIQVGAPAAIMPPVSQWPGRYFAPEWPQVEVEQRLPYIPPPIIIVSGIPYPTPPAWMALHLPAFLRDWSIPVLTQRPLLIDVGDPAIPFPEIGSWQPGTMDPPSARIQTRKIRADLMRLGDAPVVFPFLGRWQPGSMDPPPTQSQTSQVRPPAAAITDPAAGFTLAGLPGRFYIVDPPNGVFAQRLPVTPQVVLIVAVPYPTPAAWMALHGPAFLRDVFQNPSRRPLIKLGSDPIAMPKLGLWVPGTMDPPDTSKQLANFRLRLLGVGDPPVPFPPKPTWNAITPPPVAWEPFGQRVVHAINPVVLYPIKFEDFSGPRYQMVDFSGARYEMVELSDGRYVMQDLSGNLYLGIDLSRSGFDQKDVN